MVRHGVGCAGPVRVDPANQNEHRVKPRGVRADTVETTPWPRSLSDTSSDVIVDMLSDEIDSVRLIRAKGEHLERFALHTTPECRRGCRSRETVSGHGG